jgi:hypothetical protein
MYQELANRMHIVYYGNTEYSFRDIMFSPWTLWNPNGEYFLTMESALSRTSAACTIYPLFTGLEVFDILDSTVGHICTCPLICGIFEDFPGRRRPCAVLYTDQDPGTKDLFDR